MVGLIFAVEKTPHPGIGPTCPECKEGKQNQKAREAFSRSRLVHDIVKKIRNDLPKSDIREKLIEYIEESEHQGIEVDLDAMSQVIDFVLYFTT